MTVFKFDIHYDNVVLQPCLPCDSGLVSNQHTCLLESSGILEHRASLCSSMVGLMPLLEAMETNTQYQHEEQ